MKLTWKHAPLLGVGVAWAVGIAVLATRQPGQAGPVPTTMADIRAMHADVRVGAREVRGEARLADGDRVTTGPDGRARVRLDDGTLVVVGGGTELELHDGRMTLGRGRIFVQGGAASHTAVVLGGATTTVSSSAAAFEAGAATAGKIYCARGELVVSDADHQEHVASGETATIDAAGTKVAPEAAFDDWTGGLAVPWEGETSQASAIAALWGGATGEDPGAALVVRSADVDVDIQGEVAVTRTRTTYFNGSDRMVPAEVRLALPPGAIVSRVARVDGKQASEATVRAGNPDDATATGGRLEWAGGGWLRGTLPSIPSGGAVELQIDYVEWLAERGGHATYRFPMATEGQAPMVGELSAHVTSSPTSARWISSSAGTTAAGQRIELHRGDVRPTGDLVVEVAPSVVRPGAARAYVAPAGPGQDPYVLVRTEVPENASAGITLALVVDTSFSVGAAGLETERAVVDAVLEGLGSHDALAVLAADQTVRAVGPAKPEAVTPALRRCRRARRELAAIHAGGASNVAIALERAADLIDAQDDHGGSGMVVYLGDGRPSIGEATAHDLRRRLGRRAGGVPRIGAVAAGHGADRWLLAQLVAGSGPVYAALDRADAARVGAAIVADALESTLRDVDIDLGPTVDRIYPRARPGAAMAGGTVTVTGRLRGKLPPRVGFRYRRGGEMVQESRALDGVGTPAAADLAARWAIARLEDTRGARRGHSGARDCDRDRRAPADPLDQLGSSARPRSPSPSTGGCSACRPRWTRRSPRASSPSDRRPRCCSSLRRASTATRACRTPRSPPPSARDRGRARGRRGVPRRARGRSSGRHRRAPGRSVGRRQGPRGGRACRRDDAARRRRRPRPLRPQRRGLDRVLSFRLEDPRRPRAAPATGPHGAQDAMLGRVDRAPARAPGPLARAPAERPPRLRHGLQRRARLPTLEAVWLGAPRPAAGRDGEQRRPGARLDSPRVRRARRRVLCPAGGPAACPERRASCATVSRALIGSEPSIAKQLDKAYAKAKSDEDRLQVVLRFLRLAPHDPLCAALPCSRSLESLTRATALVEARSSARVPTPRPHALA